MKMGGRLEFDDGRYYIGSLLDLKPHGLGVMYDSEDVERYAGEFHQGNETTGVMTQSNGDVYEGFFQSTSPVRGLGTKRNPQSKVTFYGEYNMSGDVTYGILRMRNSRAKYSGSIVNNLPHGFGYMTYDCYNLYTGELIHGKRHGIGQLMTTVYGRATRAKRSRSNASINVFLDDSEDELAEDVELVGCSNFRSGFTLDLRSRTEKSDVVDDEVEENGFCLLKSSDEFINPKATEIYIGEWKDDKRNGYGEVTRNDGSSYVGQWKNNKRHGYGTTRFSDKSIERGRYDNNKLAEASHPTRFHGQTVFLNRVADAKEKAEEIPKMLKEMEEQMKSKHYAACNKADRAMDYHNKAKSYAADARLVAKNYSLDDECFVLDNRYLTR